MLTNVVSYLLIGSFLVLQRVLRLGFVGLAGIQAKADQVQVGSISGKNISQEELDLIPAWERFFKQARKNKPLLLEAEN